MSNRFGRLFSWTTFGESHGAAVGVVIDGCPAGVKIDVSQLQKSLDRRRPGQTDKATQKVLVTERNELDQVQVISGVFEGVTLGTPIMVMVHNRDQRSQDYDKIQKSPRVGHADDTWVQKFGHVDHRGGGRASARETVARVMAGYFAEQYLVQKHPKVQVTGFVKAIGEHSLSLDDLKNMDQQILNKSFNVDEHAARFPQKKIKIDELLLAAKEQGESYGGVVEVWVDHMPQGLGEPVFGKLKNELASAMMSIGATCGFEMGEGFALTIKKGTEVHKQSDSPVYGGVRGGISTGERLIFRLGFKPTSTILDTAKAGRHDPCIVPRAVPVVEAMTWAVLADLDLLQRSNRL